jgi:hypothetical protein
MLAENVIPVVGEVINGALGRELQRLICLPLCVLVGVYLDFHYET